MSEDDEWIEEWCAYAKGRYESARSGIIEFRSWARQLVAAVAVVVGLEITILLKVLELRTPWKFLGILCLFVTIIYQLLIARRLVEIGYQMAWTREVPRNPSATRYALRKKGTASKWEVLGEQYAEGYRDRRAISKKIAEELATESRGFIRSLLGLLLAVFLAAGASLLQRPQPPQTVVISPQAR